MTSTSQTNTKMTYSQLYGKAGLMYIRYDAEIENKPNGQKKIGHKHGPSYSKLQKQPVYKKGDGKYYSLLMGREFQPGRFVVLLDFDNKEDENAKNGLELLKKLKMNKRGAPRQSTPSGGFHYLFYADAVQKEQITSKTTIMYEGTKYSMDVKFRNSLCNCAPSRIEDYGKYEWDDPYQLLDIPQLPNDLFEMIRTPPSPPPPSVAVVPAASEAASEVAVSEPEQDLKASLKDVRALCCCLSIPQLDDYATWVRLGMILKKVGAPVSLWEEVSKRSKKFKPGDCTKKWGNMHPRCFDVRSLMVLAKQGNLEMYERIKPTLTMNLDTFEDDVDYQPIPINTPYLTTKPGQEPNKDQQQFKQLVDQFMEQASQKSLIIRSRYGSGKTTFLQELIRERKPKKVLFITYRQTLARDIMRNFSKLGFQNYLDSYDNPGVWNSPRLIVQLDSLLNILLRNDRFVCENSFDLDYDMIVLDESESLLNHLDEKTMENKEIQTWDFFDQVLKHSKKLILLDGDMSQRSLSFAASYGNHTYIVNSNTEGNKIFNLMLDKTKWQNQLHEDIERLYEKDPKFRICVVSQGAIMAGTLEEDLKAKYPHLNIKKLVGTDGGETKKQFLEDINQTLEDANVFIYSPVIESGVDITVKVSKIFGMLCNKSNCQRAYLQMLARCRNVEDPRMDILNDPRLKPNKNYCFWKFREVLELNRHTVKNTELRFVVEGSQLTLEDQSRNERRKMISVFNTTEKLNKHPSVYLNYLRVLATGKGMTFQIQEDVAEADAQTPKAEKKNLRVSSILEAKDLDPDEYEEITTRKKMGKTTTDENNQWEKHFWKRFFVVKQLDEKVLKNFMYGTNPLNNFLSLIDIRNFDGDDNLKTAKHEEKVKLITKMLYDLGFDSPLDSRALDPWSFYTNFVCNVLEDPAFRNYRRLNELFDMRKDKRINEKMSLTQITNWTNQILEPFSLKITGKEETYKLELLNDIVELIRRKNARGKSYHDAGNLLSQPLKREDPFQDDAAGAAVAAGAGAAAAAAAAAGPDKKRRRVATQLDTSLLDIGVNMDEDEPSPQVRPKRVSSKFIPDYDW